MSDGQSIVSLVLSGLVSGGVIATVLGFLFVSRTTQIEEEIRNEFETSREVFRSQRDWEEASISELLGPINIQLDRTERAFRRWRSKNLYLEAKVIREGNVTIRDLLLTRAHLIPPDLLEDAGKLVEHYDVWLEKFEKQREAENPDLEAAFTFVGPDGYPFPREAADRFQARYTEVWVRLYGPDQEGPSASAPRARDGS